MTKAAANDRVWKGADGLMDNLVPISSLRRFPGNARRGNVEFVRSLLRKHGQFRAIVVNRHKGGRFGDDTIIAGNHTTEAAQAEGWSHIAVSFIDVDDVEAEEINVADNVANDKATYDHAALLAQLERLPAPAEVGFDPADMKALIAKVRGAAPKPEPQTNPDDVPPVPVAPHSKTGDVWLLGPHRVMCGDSTVRAEVERLMVGKRASLMVTDPPYGVMYRGSDKKENSVHGDLSQSVIPVSFTVAVESALDDDARLYIFGGSTNWGMYAKLFDHYLRMEPHPIVWVKESFVLRHNNYHAQFEVVYFGWKGSGGKPSHWAGDRKQSDVWRVSRDLAKDRVHPTQKPVELVSIPITNSVEAGGLVFEPFLGSGSTLIAAHLLDRVCYGMEMEPAFVDVVCRRFQQVTGILPVNEATGESFDFVGHGSPDGVVPGVAVPA